MKPNAVMVGNGEQIFAVGHYELRRFEGCKVVYERVSGGPSEALSENTNQSIGVSTYQVTRELPMPKQDELPSVEDLEEVVKKLRSEMDTLQNDPFDER